jgi:hypothetical protein
MSCSLIFAVSSSEAEAAGINEDYEHPTPSKGMDERNVRNQETREMVVRAEVGTLKVS